MASEAGPSGRPDRVEGMGWLTESSVQPRKRRAIEGVGAAGLVDLRATVYRAEEQAWLVRTGELDPADASGRRKAGIDVSALRNPGVDERSQRDNAQLQTPDTQLKASRTALERKSEIYARLAAGNACDDDDEDLYHVDFVRKEPPREGLQQASHAAFGYDYGGGGSGLREGGSGGTGAETRAPDVRGEEARERRRRDWEAGEQSKLAAELAEEDARRERAQAAEDMEAGTAAARQRAAAAKDRAEAAAVRKREQLKKAFLQQQLAKLKAAKKEPLKLA